MKPFSLKPKKFSYFSIILILTVFAGVFLRLLDLGKLPGIMHRDELAIAYNAYSILETQHDEWGQTWPIVFKSFGDYKLPGLIYSTILGIWIFGLNPFGARVVTAVLASMAIPIMFILTNKLFKSRLTALLSTIFLIFSFWHLSGSRNIYEPIVALPLAIASYLTLFQAVKRHQFLWISVLLFAVSSWFYHTPLFIYPPLFVLWFFYNQVQFSKKTKKIWILAFASVVILAGLNIFALAQVNQSRSGTTIFMSQELKDLHQTEMHKFWVTGVPLNPMFTLVERFFQISYYFVQGYFKGISPDFLFFTGGNNYWHNLQIIGFGNLNPVLLPLIVLGLIYLIKNRQNPENYFLLVLLVLTPIPNAMTVDAPNINRLMDFHYLLLIVAALGSYNFYKNARKIVVFFVAFVYILVTSQFLAKYFLTYNLSLHPTWHEAGMAELVETVTAKQSEYEKVIIIAPIPAPHIFFLFYTQYSPQKLIGNSDNNIDNIYFMSELPHFDSYDENILLVTAVIKHPREDAVFLIKNWEDKPLWQGYELKSELPRLFF